MQIHSVLFNVPRRGSQFEKYAEVLEYTAQENSPRTPLVIHRVEEREDREILDIGAKVYAKATYIDNSRKTKHHCNIIQEANDGELICLIDCDMFILEDMSAIEMEGADFAYTLRPGGAQFKFSTGTIFVRVSNKTKEFYQRWHQVVLEMLKEPSFHEKWKPRYGGINQCGLAYLLEERDWGFATKELDCWEWNCENESYKLYQPGKTRAVHIAGELRRVVNRQANPRTENVKKLWQLWRGYQKSLQAKKAFHE